MKICVTSNGDSLESNLDPRFGRAAYFIVVDTETGDYEAIVNAAANTGGGAGITSGQFVVDKDVEAIITGNVGPNAASVLKMANIKMYRGISGSIKDNIDSFNEGSLTVIESSVPPHYGMGR